MSDFDWKWEDDSHTVARSGRFTASKIAHVSGYAEVRHDDFPGAMYLRPWDDKCDRWDLVARSFLAWRDSPASLKDWERELIAGVNAPVDEFLPVPEVGEWIWAELRSGEVATGEGLNS